MYATLFFIGFSSTAIGQEKILFSGIDFLAAQIEEPFDYFQDGQSGNGLRLVVTVNLDENISMRFVRVQAGSIQMGGAFAESKQSPSTEMHNARITRSFYLSSEVTRGQFRAFVRESGYVTEAESDGQGGWGYNQDSGEIEGRDSKYTWKNTGFTQTKEHPVVNVTWNDANAFCQWLTKRTGALIRLPTEAEWEYSCRAGSDSAYYSGVNPLTLIKIGNVADGTAKEKFQNWDSDMITGFDGYVFTSPVGKFKANLFGLHDMQGNVWEWCQDWYGSYEDLASEDPVQTEFILMQGQKGRIIRGGGFGKRTPRTCSASFRTAGVPTSRDIDLGFRVSFRED